MILLITIWKDRKTGETCETKFECIDLEHAEKLTKKLRISGMKLIRASVKVSVSVNGEKQ